MSKNPESTTKGNFQHAERTLQSAWALRHICHRWEPSEKIDGMLTFQPMYYVLSTFALELYIKTILRISNTKPHGHQLEELWTAVPAKDKRLMEELFLSTSLPATKHQINGQLDKLFNPNAQYVQPTLASIFEKYDNYFKFWRYGFEHEQKDQAQYFGFDDRAVQAAFITLRIHILKLRPSYDELVILDNWLQAMRDGAPLSLNYRGE